MADSILHNHFLYKYTKKIIAWQEFWCFTHCYSAFALTVHLCGTSCVPFQVHCPLFSQWCPMTGVWHTTIFLRAFNISLAKLSVVFIMMPSESEGIEPRCVLKVHQTLKETSSNFPAPLIGFILSLEYIECLLAWSWASLCPFQP